MEMRKVNDYHIETFKYKMDFMVDVVTTPESYDVWLYSESYGIKMMMFGLPNESISYDEIIEIIEANLKKQNYIAIYKKLYEGDD